MATTPECREARSVPTLATARLFATALLCLTLPLISCTLLRPPAVEFAGPDPAASVREIPFEYQDGFILLRARVNDEAGESLFLLDTGSGGSSVTPEFRERHGCESPPYSIHFVATDLTGKKKVIPWCALRTVSFGAVSFRNVVVAVMPLERFNQVLQVKIDGILGSRTLANTVIRIDYSRKVLTIADGKKHGLTEFENAHRVQLEWTNLSMSQYSHSPPFLTCTLNGRSVSQVLLDTGNNATLILPPATFREIGGDLKGDGVVRTRGDCGRGLLGSYQEVYGARLKTLELGGLRLENLPLAIADSPCASLGNGFLERFLVQIHYPRKELLLVPVRSPEPESEPSTFGLSWSCEDGKAVVDCLSDRSAAAEAGLEIGDRIVRVNGRDITPDLSREQICELRKFLQSLGPLELVWSHQGQVREATLERRGLF